MAHITHLYIHSSDIGKGTITAHTKLKPSGEAQVKFSLPEGFHDCIMKAAQAAADLHEQQMRAEILADNAAQQGE